jgi:PAS domain S-box-containing protein
VALLGVLLRPANLSSLFSSNYLPHRFCYLAQPGLVWTNAITDGLIAVAYSVIFCCLVFLLLGWRRIEEMRPHLWVFASFGLFIMACGMTHVMDVVTVWVPLYPMSAAVKVACALVSVPTAIAFARRTPMISRKLAGYIELVSAERQESFEALCTMEKLLDRTGRLAGVGGWEVDLESDQLTWSAETFRIFGFPPDRQPGLEEALCLYTPESRELLTEAFHRARTKGIGWSMELQTQRLNGQPIWVRCVAGVERLPGDKARINGAIQDISAQVERQEALRRANERIALATESGRIGIWDWEVQDEVLSWDAWTFRIYGLDSNAGPASYGLWARHLHPEDRAAAEAAIARALESGGLMDTEFRTVWPDGSVHHVRAAGRVTRDPAGRPLRMVGANWDVTEQRQMVFERERLMKLELKLRDDFLSHVSHELRSPLASIYSFSSIMADGLAGVTTPEQEEYLGIVLKNSAQLQAMIEDLLHVTQSQEGILSVAPTRISALEAILECVQTLQWAATAKNIVIVCDGCADLPAVYADPTRLRQVLIILLDNAVKFTPPRGRVEVHVVTKRADSLLIQVSDTGCGMPAQEIGKVFDHLYQIGSSDRAAGRNGLGLGLHIARDLVGRQGGKIWATSVEGKGSVFSFTVPTDLGHHLEADLQKARNTADDLSGRKVTVR